MRLFSHYWASVSVSTPVGGTTGRLLITMRGFRAALLTRGLGCLEFPGIPRCWAERAGMTLSSCDVPVPLRLAKSTCFSFVPGAPVAGTGSQVLLFHFSNIEHTVHCVSALPVQIARAGCLVVLAFHSLPTPIPFLPLRTWVGGSAQVLPGRSLYLTPFVRC